MGKWIFILISLSIDTLEKTKQMFSAFHLIFSCLLGEIEERKIIIGSLIFTVYLFKILIRPTFNFLSDALISFIILEMIFFKPFFLSTS